jgi:hypothetical protein
MALFAVMVMGSAGLLLAARARGEDGGGAMERSGQKQMKLNPKAPPELARFAFLVGKYRSEAKIKRDDGSWDDWKGTWAGHFIVDGYAIEDEFRMTTMAGELIVLGVNLRAYDAKNKEWNIKWLNAVGPAAGTWTDLGSNELGGVTMDEKGISYLMKEPMAPHKFTRATYTNISDDHFTWRGERSNDKANWEEFLVIENYRVK